MSQPGPSLVTGSPIGSVIGQENTYLEGAPYIYFQDALAGHCRDFVDLGKILGRPFQLRLAVDDSDRPLGASGDALPAAIAEGLVDLDDFSSDHGEAPELAGKFKRIEPFVAMIEDFRQRADTQVADLLIANLIAEIKLLPALLEEDPIVGQTKVENVEAFVEGAADFARAHQEGPQPHGPVGGRRRDVARSPATAPPGSPRGSGGRRA